MEARGCCFGAYATMTEAARDPVMVTRNPLFGQADNPSGADYPAPGPFANLPHQDRGVPRSAPRLGEHTGEVLSDLLHLPDIEIAELADQGIVALG